MLEKIYEEYKERLSKSDHKIFGYLLEHEQELPAITAEDLSRRLNISTATISRFWSKIGFQNLKDLKHNLGLSVTARASSTARLIDAAS